REFKTHIAAAQHEEVFRQSVEVERLNMRHRFRGAESRHFGHGRAGAEVEEHAVGEDSSFATAIEINLSGPRSYESSVAHDQFRAALRGGIGVHLMEPFNHQPLASL